MRKKQRQRKGHLEGHVHHGHDAHVGKDLTESLENLKPHDHLCLIYESPDEWRSAVVPFIRIGLERGEKCMYVVDTHTADEVRRHLADAGVDVSSVEGSGQLVILKESEAYTQGGTFDPDRMIALLIEATQKAISEGYPALRITGEMTWVLRGMPGAERVIEYEAKLNRDLFPHHPCLAICQYDRWAFDPEIIKGVVMTHPILIREGKVHQNFYYIPPEEFLNAKRADHEVQHWLNNLTRERESWEQLRESEARHRQLFEESPIALLEEDLSAVKREMDALRASGVTDLGAYFGEHPDVVPAWIEKIHVVRANRHVRELFGRGDDEGVHVHLTSGVPSPRQEVLRSEFIDLFCGNAGRSYRGKEQDRQGNTVETLVRLSVVPGHEEQLDRVLVSIEDVTAQERAREEIERSFRQARKSFEDTVASLSALSEARDPYTAGHQRQVARLACAIAERMGLDEERVDGLRMAAILHDIGKASVPTEILSKPTMLSELEFSMIREHSKAGSEILQGISFPCPVAEIVLQHHERLDGSGYPQGLKGDAILLEARILAVADVVEAMASHRPYRAALGVEAALAEIRKNRGKLYDRDVVDACLALFEQGFRFAGKS